MSRNDFEVTDEQEAEFRRIISPMIVPLIVMINEAIEAGPKMQRGESISHHVQNFEDALTTVVKYCAESELL